MEQIFDMVQTSQPVVPQLDVRMNQCLRMELVHFLSIFKLFSFINSKIVQSIDISKVEFRCFCFCFVFFRDLRYSSLFVIVLINYERCTTATDNSIRSTLPIPEEFSKALFTIDIGQNDLSAGFRKMTNDQFRMAIPDIINEFAIAIEVSQFLSIDLWFRSERNLG